MKNSVDLGGCYPPRLSASVDNTLLDLQNSSYPTQPHSIIAKYLSTESEVITGKSQTETLMYWPSDVIYYMALFSAILKKNKTKTRQVIFHIRLRAVWLSSSLKKYMYASFSFSYWQDSFTLSIFFVVFADAFVALLTTQKSCWAEKKIHNARSLQENNARSATNQSARTIVAI